MELSEEQWKSRWSSWAKKRKKGVLAGFILNLLEEGKSAKWVDIRKGKFVLQEWSDIAELWYHKKTRIQPLSRAPTMLRKSMLKAFPNIIELNKEIGIKTRKITSRMYSCPKKLMNEVHMCATDQLVPTTEEGHDSTSDVSSKGADPPGIETPTSPRSLSGLTSARKSLRKLSKKFQENSMTEQAPRNTSNVSERESFIHSMVEDTDVSYCDDTTYLDPDRMSPSIYTNSDTLNTEDSLDGESNDTEIASGTDEGLPKMKKRNVSLTRRNKKRAALKSKLKLDADTPIKKGIPFNESKIIQSIGGHECHLSPIKKCVGVTPVVRRSRRNRVPIGSQYVHALDENVLPTVADLVKPLEEPNEKLNFPRKRPIKRVSPNACFLDHAFSNLPLDQAEAKIQMKNSKGDLMDVDFMKHLSVCPKITIDGATATKEDPLIINPVFRRESCTVGLIVLNVDGNKRSQVAAEALVVFLLMSGKIEVEMQKGDFEHKQDIQPISRFWIPEGFTYSIKNIERTAAELVYIRLKV